MRIPSGTPFEFVTSGWPTGLVGTLGTTLVDATGTIISARATSGIEEIAAGVYLVTRNAPSTPGFIAAITDDGTDSPDGTTTDHFDVYLAGTVGPGLVSTADLDARRVEYEDTGQAQAAIDDASAIARDFVAPVFDALEAPNAPASVVAVVVGMVRRVLTNPRGLQQEQLGDYMFAAGTNAVATLIPTQREKRILRQAAAIYAKANGMIVPSWGAGGAYQQADLPAPPAFWDGIKLPSDDYTNP